jgi:hypothetical protein
VLAELDDRAEEAGPESAGSQTRLRKFARRCGVPVWLGKTSSLCCPWVLSASTTNLGRGTDRTPARDFGYGRECFVP